MNFEEQLGIYIEKIGKVKDKLNTEEATKTSLIMPFFQLLGYDVFNPSEFIPEYVADVGIKKGEKVDYAIILNGTVSILIEAKSINEKLERHDSQLFRYFGTTKAKFAILTNGIVYKFYTDLEKINVMDSIPFLTINLENLRENDIIELKKFQKEFFDVENIFNSASDLKYLSQIKSVCKELFANPNDEFIKLILNQDIYSGVKTQNIIDKYKPLVKKSLNVFINDLINDRLQNALKSNDENLKKEMEDESYTESIVTTVEEMEAYYIVKSILSEQCDANKIFYKDTIDYFGILYDNKVTRWICRIYFKKNVKFIIIPDADKKEVRYDINNANDIYQFKNEIINRYNEVK